MKDPLKGVVFGRHRRYYWADTAIHFPSIENALIQMAMRTVQCTIDDELLRAVDKAADEMKISRSAFIRQSLQLALERIEILRLEQQHAVGYTLRSVVPGEFDGWESEQVWDASA